MRQPTVLVSAAVVCVLAATGLSGAPISQTAPQSQRAPAATPTASAAGIREAAWSPDGRRLAVTYYEAIWTMTPEGRDAKRLVSAPEAWVSERDAAWSTDGKLVAFAADTNGAFDLWLVPATGGRARQLTSLGGDARWPSWTRDGQVVFSHRAARGPWQLYIVSAAGTSVPTKLTPDERAEWQAAVAPNGESVAFVSDRALGAGDAGDIWVRSLPAAGRQPAAATRLTEGPGIKAHPTWAPDSSRVAYYALRPGAAAGVYVSDTASTTASATGRGGRGGRGGPGVGRGFTPMPESPLLASRHAGVPAWSPDGQRLAIATFPAVADQYNGNPDRNDDEPPMVMAEAASYTLWTVDAPRAVDQDAAAVAAPPVDTSRWASGFDQVWQTLRALYYATGPSAAAWETLRETYRPQAVRAPDAHAFEDVVDQMVAEQPLIKVPADSNRGVATSGHPLASAAGAAILAQGGNVVDAGIAVALALGVVEPDATSLGGDGECILYLKGMKEPVVVEYKDMSPSHATSDNPKLFTLTGGRTANDGPTVANIPGVAAGLDLLYQKYGSKKVNWADLVAPAIKLADEGFVLDDALPTTIAEGHDAFARYPESAKLFLPGGKAPKAGDRFVNHDYAETLRLLAKEGGRSFYTGTIAQKVVADMEANGGVITADDLAQYRAMERTPLAGMYHGHRVYSVPAPVSTGEQLVETLQILDNYHPKPGASYATDADYFHYAIDAWRVRDGGTRIADPERWPVDYGDHLDPAHALERFHLIDPQKAYAAPAGGRGGFEPPPGAWIAEDESGRIATGTTAFVVADAEGNMIAFTQTLSTWGGNFYVSKGLGFLYNDHFRGGGGRGGYGSLLPLMRSNSTSVPTLVFGPAPAGSPGSPGVPLMAVGCAGNAWIPASVYDIILNVVDAGMSAQRAIEAPRFLIGGASVQIEDRFPRSVLANLEARGYTFQKVGRKGEVKYGYASVAVVHPAGTVEAGAEPRRSHGAVAVK